MVKEAVEEGGMDEKSKNGCSAAGRPRNHNSHFVKLYRFLKLLIEASILAYRSCRQTTPGRASALASVQMAASSRDR